MLLLRVEDQEAFVDDRRVALSPLEFRLLWALARNADRILSRDQLLRLVWDDWNCAGSDRVKFTVLRLRRKLGPSVRIEAVRGYGYRYSTPEGGRPALS